METNDTVARTDVLQGLEVLAQETIYLMGVSFMLGSLFTILLLLILDFMRRNKIEKSE